jgi:hypothetical protein
MLLIGIVEVHGDVIGVSSRKEQRMVSDHVGVNIVTN